MPNYSIKILDSVDKLVVDGEAWNSLWARTGNLSPLVRAESVALWMRQFAPDALFRAVVIESGGIAVAGIPLYLHRKAKFLRIGVLPNNGWGSCGNLLLDASRQDHEAIFSCLVKGLQQLPIDFLWCNGIRYENFPWKIFREHWTDSGHSSRTTLSYHTAVIPLYGDPEAVAATWNKREIANTKRRFRKLCTPENHEFRAVSNTDEIAALLPDCFALEHAGWKGREGRGGSIVKMGMEEYYLTQAKILAEQNLARLYVLFVDGRLVAFQHDCLAGKTVFCMKIGYDSTMREFAPGMIIQWLINLSLLERQDADYFDFLGIAGQHQKIWNSELHAVGEVVFSLTLQGKIALSLHKLYANVKSHFSQNASAKTDES